MIAFVYVKLRPGAEKPVLDTMSSIEEVKRIYELFGEWDGMLKIETENSDSLNFIVDKIRKNNNIEMTSTMIVANTIKP